MHWGLLKQPDNQKPASRKIIEAPCDELVEPVSHSTQNTSRCRIAGQQRVVRPVLNPADSEK